MSNLITIISGKCPCCQKSKVFEKSSTSNFFHIPKMRDNCNFCGHKFCKEPGFFFGAMYVSYAVGIAFAVAAFVIANLFLGADLITTFIAIVATMIVFMPVIIRLSRNIWINFFFKYDSEAAKIAS